VALGKVGFAECQLGGTRQRLVSPSVRFLPSTFWQALSKKALCRVLNILHSAKPLALGISGVSGSDTSLPYLFPACSIYSKILQYNWSIECKTIVFQEYNYNSKVNHQCLHSIELIFERDDFRTESERHFFLSFLRCGEMNLASNPRSHMHAPSIMLRFGVQNNRFQMIHMTTCTDSKLE